MKTKSHPKPAVDFDSNLKSVKSNRRSYLKKYQSKTTKTINKCV